MSILKGILAGTFWLHLAGGSAAADGAHFNVTKGANEVAFAGVLQSRLDRPSKEINSDAMSDGQTVGFFSASATDTKQVEEAGPPWIATGIPDRGDFTPRVSVNPLPRADLEMRLLQEALMERDFADWCSFNGFDRSADTVLAGKLYQCVVGGDYRAVLDNGDVKIFKRGADGQMIALKFVVWEESSRKNLIDIGEARANFVLPAK
jgi:hypothetical protein